MTIRRLTHRLSFRHAVVSVLAAAVVGLVVTLASLANELCRERDQIAVAVADAERAMLAPAAQAAFMLDPALAQGIAAGLLNNGIFVNARITDDNGRILAQVGERPRADIGEVGKLLLSGLRGIAVPLQVDRADPASGALQKLFVGRLFADLDQQAILSRMLDRAGTLLLFGLVQTLILGLILAISYQFVLSRPILGIADDLRKVDPRAPAAALVRVPRGHRRTEIGFLVGKTNALLRQFSATLRKSERIQEELGKERAHLDGIMQSVVDAIVTIDADLKVQRTNHAATVLFGHNAQEFRGVPIQRLFAEADWPIVEETLATADNAPLAGGGAHQEVVACDRSGRRIAVSIGISRMRFGPERNFVCIIRDVTARKQAERRLAEALRDAEEANRAKSQFLATMSHELRTPLNAIIGFSDMIREELLGPIGVPTYVEYARDISESGSHLLSIINDILDISKIEAGQATINPERLDVRQVISGCVDLMQHQADAAGVTLVLEVEAACPLLYADARSMKQIVINLVSNAIKFTSANGRVCISACSSSNGGVRVSVSDTGIGIAEQDLARIWRPFEQVENALSRRKGGTGLGLPLVKRLADLHGAAIAITSNLGEGTVIALDFPPGRQDDRVPLYRNLDDPSARGRQACGDR